MPLEIPPLRERMGDIVLLLNHFMRNFAAEHNLPPSILSKSAINRLQGYQWPGNVRELRNVCERLSILLAGRTIEENNLPAEILVRPAKQTGSFVLPEEGLVLDKLELELIQQALNRTNGNRSRSARLLGISRDTLLYRMQKHNLR